MAASRLTPDAVGQHLHRHVAVAEMPGKPRERVEIGGARLDQRLRRGDDLDQRAILEHQAIVGIKPRRRVQVDVDRDALDGGDADLAGAALGVVENDGVDDRPIVTLAVAENAGCSGHRIAGVDGASSIAPGAHCPRAHRGRG